MNRDEEKAMQIDRMEEEHAAIARKIREIPWEYDQYGEKRIPYRYRARLAQLVKERRQLDQSLGVAYRS